MLFIRADGNSDIGMGHVMRCLSIAEAVLEKYGISPTFITADNMCRDIIKDRGFDNIVLCTDYRNMESEIVRLSYILTKEDTILVDSYQVTDKYYIELQKICRTACLEDMGRPYLVDILINYNIYAPNLKDKYMDDVNHVGLPVNVYLGIEYLPLRKLFRTDLEYKVKDKITDVMITTGGSDPLYAMGSILGELVDIPDITFHAVSGPLNGNVRLLKAEYGNLRNVVIYENLNELKTLMKRCDVVITATGSTVYEVCAIGIPMICFYFAENQRQGAIEIGRLTDVVNAGCFETDKAGTANRICQTLKKCMEDYSYRESLYHQEKRLVDGTGALRIADILLKEPTYD